MKKAVLKSLTRTLAIGLLSCCALTIYCLTSCSNQNEITEISQNEEIESDAFNSLMDELDSYNHEYQNSHPTMKTRGFFSSLWRAVKADFKGLKSPTTICGITLSISQSRAQWKKDKIEKQQENILMESCSPEEKAKIIVMIDSLKNEYVKDRNNVGAIHNAAILSTFIQNNQNYSNTTQLVESTLSSLKKLGVNTSGVNISQLAINVDKYFQDIDDPDDHVVFERLRKLDPNRTDELNVLENYFSNVQYLDNLYDITEFTDNYVHIIDKSKISYTAKSNIISNISIAPASFNLWNNVIK